ncbi:MAG TPA: Gfo/Idh/MocA family oxidoreductase, partial [Candidatus Eisenbacteria bacterium]|nr:Gfo/Idh/MocA family oxidoreductase [Candidatus Eisenbacteria bacterium]
MDRRNSAQSSQAGASNAAEPLRAAVVGVGHLGKFHAEKYAGSNRAQLVGVVDVDEARSRAVGELLQTEWFTDYRRLLGRVDCVSVAVPTQLHHPIAKDFLQAGVHVL